MPVCSFRFPWIEAGVLGAGRDMIEKGITGVFSVLSFFPYFTSDDRHVQGCSDV